MTFKVKSSSPNPTNGLFLIQSIDSENYITFEITFMLSLKADKGKN